MKRQRFFLGPIENPTWKDFIIRVGGALALIAVVILASRQFIPGHEGIAAMIVSLGLVAFLGVQAWRQKRSRREERNGDAF
jgi:hypothetical protein